MSLTTLPVFIDLHMVLYLRDDVVLHLSRRDSIDIEPIDVVNGFVLELWYKEVHKHHPGNTECPICETSAWSLKADLQINATRPPRAACSAPCRYGFTRPMIIPGRHQQCVQSLAALSRRLTCEGSCGSRHRPGSGSKGVGRYFAGDSVWGVTPPGRVCHEKEEDKEDDAIRGRPNRCRIDCRHGP